MSDNKKIIKTAISCRLCNSQSQYKLNILILKKYDVSFFLCESCGLLQSETPFWLNEAYSNAISNLDTGILVRNLTAMRVLTVLIRFIGDKHGSYLDYGGGHGIFTRLMRDHGYDFFWQDEYAENLYAQGFEYKKSTPLSGITAFELLEHLEEPRELFNQLLGDLRPNFLIASTQLFVNSVEPQWYYFYPETGQHIAFYQPKTMKYIAQQYGYKWVNFRYFQLFYKSILPRLLVKILIPISFAIYTLCAPFFRLNSFHLNDSKRLSKK